MMTVVPTQSQSLRVLAEQRAKIRAELLLGKHELLQSANALQKFFLTWALHRQAERELRGRYPGLYHEVTRQNAREHWVIR